MMNTSKQFSKTLIKDVLCFSSQMIMNMQFTFYQKSFRGRDLKAHWTLSDSTDICCHTVLMFSCFCYYLLYYIYI